MASATRKSAVLRRPIVAEAPQVGLALVTLCHDQTEDVSHSWVPSETIHQTQNFAPKMHPNLNQVPVPRRLRYASRSSPSGVLSRPSIVSS